MSAPSDIDSVAREISQHCERGTVPSTEQLEEWRTKLGWTEWLANTLGDEWYRNEQGNLPVNEVDIQPRMILPKRRAAV